MPIQGLFAVDSFHLPVSFALEESMMSPGKLFSSDEFLRVSICFLRESIELRSCVISAGLEIVRGLVAKEVTPEAALPLPMERVL